MTSAYLKFNALTLLRAATVNKNQLRIENATLLEENARLASQLTQMRMKWQSAEYVNATLTTEYNALRTEKTHE